MKTASPILISLSIGMIQMLVFLAYFEWSPLILILTGLVPVLWYLRFKSVPFATGGGGSVDLSDFPISRGAIIAGGVGMGKSTLRYHLIHHLQSMNYRIIDFDYKGELTSDLNDDSLLIPGKNFSFNLFSQLNSPAAINKLHRLLIETSPDEYSPAMESLLRIAITKTYQHGGDLQFFFDTILYEGFQLSDEDGLGSSKTAFALLNRLIWLQDELGSVFNTKSGINLAGLTDNDLFFDLSHLTRTTSQFFVSGFINIFLSILVLQRNTASRIAIFIEEAQLLMSYSDKLQSVVQIISTLRYRNVPVFLLGTTTVSFPQILFDSTNYFQFRSSFSSHPRIQSDRLSQYEFIYIGDQHPLGVRLKLLKFSRKLIIPKYRPIRLERQSIINFDTSSITKRLIRYTIKITIEFDYICFARDQAAVISCNNLLSRVKEQSLYDPYDLFFSYLLLFPDIIIHDIDPRSLRQLVLILPKFLVEYSDKLEDVRMNWILVNSRNTKG